MNHSHKITEIYSMLYPYDTVLSKTREYGKMCSLIRRKVKDLCLNNQHVALLMVGKYIGMNFIGNEDIMDLCNRISDGVIDLCLSNPAIRESFVLYDKFGLSKPVTRIEILTSFFLECSISWYSDDPVAMMFVEDLINTLSSEILDDEIDQEEYWIYISPYSDDEENTTYKGSKKLAILMKIMNYILHDPYDSMDYFSGYFPEGMNKYLESLSDSTEDKHMEYRNILNDIYTDTGREFINTKITAPYIFTPNKMLEQMHIKCF